MLFDIMAKTTFLYFLTKLTEAIMKQDYAAVLKNYGLMVTSLQ